MSPSDNDIFMSYTVLCLCNFTHGIVQSCSNAGKTCQKIEFNSDKSKKTRLKDCVSIGSVCTCMLHISGGVSIRHGVNIHKLLLKHRQQEGEAVVETNV